MGNATGPATVVSGLASAPQIVWLPSMTAAASPARNVAMVATFAGLTGALALLPPITPVGVPVPITAQTLGVMLCGAILGPWRGLGALMLLLGLGAIGLPVFAGGQGGLGVFMGPTVGYLVAFPVGAAIVGWLTYMIGQPYRLWWGIVANLVGGVVVINAGGVIGLVLRADMSWIPATVATGWFAVGDLIKAVLVAIIAQGVHAAYPTLLPPRPKRHPAS